MLTAKTGEAAAREIEDWANRIAGRVDATVRVNVYQEMESSTYVLRLAKEARVLIFRLSEAQVRTDGREAECERAVLRKIQDLRNLI